MTTTSPRVYVGTYAKYNSGSIKGEWLDLEDYADRDAFMEACKELHKDEPDPELMFQDFEGFPKGFYGESHIDAALWEWLEIDENDRELLEVYQEHVDQNGDIEAARDAYCGNGYSTMADYAEELLESTGELQAIPENLRNYFDFEAYARDLDCSGYVFARHDGDLWVFMPV